MVLRAPGGAGKGLALSVSNALFGYSVSVHSIEACNYLKPKTFFCDSHFLFDKPTCFLFMVGGLQAARQRVLGNPIL